MKQIFAYTWKLSLCATGFFLSMAFISAVLPVQVFWPHELTAGTDRMALVLGYSLGGIFLAFVLSLISLRLRASWLARWIILAELTWTCGVVGMAVKSFFFTPNGPVVTLINALFTLLSFLLPSLFISGLVAVLFRSAPSHEQPQRTFPSSRKAADLLSRAAAAWLA